ncbi:MAG: type II toxin-antitoxin system HicB family antitoxin [Candidatus Gracilibacteria bacterium]|nr:type II toxin-antitoxin system HicB family antitoxin [Candidatus Gracilibacteria bacterium]MDQ7023692.1 type II toxin-antitoxin system HicB family antitoxin [Candidatus Gracilibacteria bacterium]
MKAVYTLIFMEEEIGYSVSVLELPGCISEGDTKKEALNNIKEAIGLYIESMSDIALLKANKENKISVDSLTYEYEAV